MCSLLRDPPSPSVSGRRCHRPSPARARAAAARAARRPPSPALPLPQPGPRRTAGVTASAARLPPPADRRAAAGSRAIPAAPRSRRQTGPSSSTRPLGARAGPHAGRVTARPRTSAPARTGWRPRDARPTTPRAPPRAAPTAVPPRDRQRPRRDARGSRPRGCRRSRRQAPRARHDAAPPGGSVRSPPRSARRASSCRKATCAGPPTSIPEARHSSSRSTSSPASASSSEQLDLSRDARRPPRAALRAAPDSRAARASTASRTVSGISPCPAARISVTKNGFPPVWRYSSSASRRCGAASSATAACDSGWSLIRLPPRTSSPSTTRSCWERSSSSSR